jgi:hypothetical protein
MQVRESTSVLKDRQRELCVSWASPRGVGFVDLILCMLKGVPDGCHSPFPVVSTAFCFFEVFRGLSSGGGTGSCCWVWGLLRVVGCDPFGWGTGRGLEECPDGSWRVVKGGSLGVVHLGH